MFKKMTTVFLSGCILVGLTSCGGMSESWIAEYDDQKVNIGIYTQYMMDGCRELYIKNLTGQLTLDPTKTEEEQDNKDNDQKDEKAQKEELKNDKIGSSDSKNSEKSDKKLEEKSQKTSFLKKYLDNTLGSDWVVNYGKDKILEYIAIEKKFDELKLELDKERVDYVERNLADQWDSREQQYGYEKKGISQESVLKLVLSTLKKQAIFDAYYAENGSKEVKDQEIQQYLKENYNKVEHFSFDLRGLKDEEKEAKKASYAEFLEKAKSGQNFGELISEFNKKEYDEQEEKEDADLENKAKDESLAIYKKEGGSRFSSKIQEEIDKAGFDQVVGVEDENECFVLIKRDPANSDDYIKENKADLLSEMKKDEFEAEIKSWTESINVKFNQKAIQAFLPEKLKLNKMFDK